MDGGGRRRLSPACLFLAVALVVLVALPELAAARTRRYTFNVRIQPVSSNVQCSLASNLSSHICVYR
jgi:laccase